MKTSKKISLKVNSVNKKIHVKFDASFISSTLDNYFKIKDETLKKYFAKWYYKFWDFLKSFANYFLIAI